MKLYSPATVRDVVKKYQFHFQKTLGQNFLIDGNIVNKIVEAAELEKGDLAVEIGAGIGTLTSALAEKAGKVIVVEIDRNLKPILDETLAGHENIETVFDNALKVNFDNLVVEKTGGEFGPGGKPYKLVANLPYYITTPLIMHALESHFNVDTMVFMIQKEVADRIMASPGGKDYGALTLGVFYYSDPAPVIRVPKQVFMPQPEVESTVIRLKTRGRPPVPVQDEKTFFAVVRAAFGQRRKTLLNTLAGLAKGMEKSSLAGLLTDLGIDPGKRGETLSFEEFALIANAMHKLNI